MIDNIDKANKKVFAIYSQFGAGVLGSVMLLYLSSIL